MAEFGQILRRFEGDGIHQRLQIDRNFAPQYRVGDRGPSEQRNQRRHRARPRRLPPIQPWRDLLMKYLAAVAVVVALFVGLLAGVAMTSSHATTLDKWERCMKDAQLQPAWPPALRSLSASNCGPRP